MWLSDKCYGGFVEEAFDFAKDNLVTERKKYPYRGKGNDCRLKGVKDAEPVKEK